MAVQIDHDADHTRYVIVLDDEPIGEAVYHDSGEGRIFTHTEITPELTSRGYGTQLVRAALDDTRSAGLKPIGQCSMVRTFLAEHPDYSGTPRR
ncbi:GNAT family N-acetyltransferase [uncultured Amnibacterium sp.]|uniref:GNAT family N-acetyltransferase n=1 Tax=uncultured Amnibacterium sp. TaxID=1631851 RepID=UPI0035CAA59F